MLAGALPDPWQWLLLAGLCRLRTDTAHHRCQRCGGDPHPGAATTCRGTVLKEEVDGLCQGEARRHLSPGGEYFHSQRGKLSRPGSHP